MTFDVLEDMSVDVVVDMYVDVVVDMSVDVGERVIRMVVILIATTTH